MARRWGADGSARVGIFTDFFADYMEVDTSLLGFIRLQSGSVRPQSNALFMSDLFVRSRNVWVSCMYASIIYLVVSSRRVVLIPFRGKLGNYISSGEPLFFC